MVEEKKSKVKKKTVVKTEKKEKSNVNPMRKIRIEKIVLNVGGIAEELEKGIKVLKLLANREPARMMSRKRIPTLNVRPKLEVGAVITIRDNKEDLLRRLLKSVGNKLSRRQMSENNFSFGVPEYIEIPDVEYQRDIGIRGLDVTVVFKRSGRRVRLRKIKTGKIPKRQVITKEELIKFMEEEFKTEFVK